MSSLRKKCGFAVNQNSHEGASPRDRISVQSRLRCGPQLGQAALQTVTEFSEQSRSEKLRWNRRQFAKVGRLSCCGSGAAGAPMRSLGMGSGTGESHPIGSTTFTPSAARTGSLAAKAGSRLGTALPNTSLNRSSNGRPPGPGRSYAVHFHRPGLGVLPLEPA